MQNSIEFYLGVSDGKSRECILADIRSLISMHRAGKLGGATMPEDVHPPIDSAGAPLCHYFTLVMALNYQRNSYALWRCATAAYEDPETNVIFSPKTVAAMSKEMLAPLLLKHRVGLQPNKHTQTWYTLCESITEIFGGDIRNLFIECQGDIGLVLERVQKTHKKRFPYLSGPKIANYWLYVMTQYTDLGLKNREALNVAPDTHVLQASCRLGLLSDMEKATSNAQQIVTDRWKWVLEGTGIAPIDIHTTLWLWSKSGFMNIE